MAIVSGTQKAKRNAAKAVAQFNGIICAFCGICIYTRWNTFSSWVQTYLTNEAEEDAVIEHFEQYHPEEAAMFVLGGNLDVLKGRVKDALAMRKKEALQSLVKTGFAAKVKPRARKYHFVDSTGSVSRFGRAAKDYAVCGENVSEKIEKWNREKLNYEKIIRELDIIQSWDDIDSKKKCMKCKRFLGEVG